MSIEENRTKWAAALRSGEFKQGKKRLRWRDRFCCLGVACEVYRRETGDGEWMPKGGFSIDGKKTTAEYWHLPVEVRDWLGLNEVPKAGPTQNELADMNDDGRSFLEIADLLEDR